jgi:conjugative transposon TraN protein
MNKFMMCMVAALLTSVLTYAQNASSAPSYRSNGLPVVYLPDNLSVHFISPEPIQYVDISTRNIAGDLPVKNVLRIRHKPDSLLANDPREAVLTVIGEKFIAQYRVVLNADLLPSAAKASVEIKPEDIRPLELAEVGLSLPEITGISYRLISKKVKGKVSSEKAFGITSSVNKISSIGDYVFVDISYQNSTKLRYEIDQFKFKIDDKKVTKATNVQSIDVAPLFTLFEINSFKKEYRNIFVFKKFTFPGNKVLLIELSEKQLSGRIITQKINYKDILEADTVPDE